MDGPAPEDSSSEPQSKARRRPSTIWLLLILVAFTTVMFFNSLNQPIEIDYSDFRKQLAAGNVAEVTFQGLEIKQGVFKKSVMLPEEKAASDTEQEQLTESQEDAGSESEGEGAKPEVEKDKATDKPESPGKSETKEEPQEVKEFRTTLYPWVGEDLDSQMLKQGVVIRNERPTDYQGLMLFVYLGVTVLLGFFLWSMFRRTRDQMMGGGLFSGFAKSPAKRYDKENEAVTFDDVAGLEGVKRDLEEVVEFLKNPERFQRLGGRVPKGVLLMGPPGTGKTLLARAVAGEAEVPFFSINGSEFIQMFVGVGAGRVRDMFKNAKDASPAILFIDEIDAVGRQRGAGLGGGHDEREQTLNQILSEMDGFSQTTSVIVLAATNRPDVLDPALLRPGRFDRHVTVNRPSQQGRKAIFEVHTRDIPLAEDVDLGRLAAGTVGLTGADIRNLANEAALWATRHDKDQVDMSDFDYARDKVLMGSKREEVLSKKEARVTAYHEAGHALLAWMLPGADRVHKVTIIPRGRALGVTQLLPEEDRLNISESEIRTRLVFMLGGRSAEKLVFDEYSAGAENDLKEATRMARRMVTHWGMSERLGPVAYTISEEHPFLGREIAQEHREFSEHTARVIDEEIARILHAAAERAQELLTAHRDQLAALAEALIEREVIDDTDIEELIGPSVNARAESNGQPPSKDGASAARPTEGSDA